MKVKLFVLTMVLVLVGSLAPGQRFETLETRNIRERDDVSELTFQNNSGTKHGEITNTGDAKFYGDWRFGSSYIGDAQAAIHGMSGSGIGNTYTNLPTNGGDPAILGILESAGDTYLVFGYGLSAADQGGLLWSNGGDLSGPDARFIFANDTNDYFVWNIAGVERLRLTDNGLLKINGSYTLPSNGGSVNQVITSDGAGGSSWAVAGGAPTTIDLSCKAGENISIGEAVYIGGATGGTPQVFLSDADVVAEAEVLGIAQETKITGQTITIRMIGISATFNTSSWSDGDQLYLSTTPGAITNTLPTQGRVIVVGHVAYSHASNGTIAIGNHVTNYTAAAANEDLDMRMGDSAGAYGVVFEDFSDTPVFEITSDGNLDMTADTWVGLSASTARMQVTAGGQLHLEDGDVQFNPDFDNVDFVLNGDTADVLVLSGDTITINDIKNSAGTFVINGDAYELMRSKPASDDIYFNDTGAAGVSIVMEGDTNASAFVFDSTYEAVGIGQAPTGSHGSLEVKTTYSSPGSHSYGSLIWCDGNDQNCVGMDIWAGVDSPSGYDVVAMNFSDGDGNSLDYLNYDGSGMYFYASSDPRFKDNLTTSTIYVRSGVIVDALAGVRQWNWKPMMGRATTNTATGWNADEIEAVFPEAVGRRDRVMRNDDGTTYTIENAASINQMKFIQPIAVETAKLRRRVANLERDNAILKYEVNGIIAALVALGLIQVTVIGRRRKIDPV